MRLTFTFFILLVFASPAFSQDLEDVLLTKPTEEGTLYHLKQVELDACKKALITADFTYLRTANQDSVRLLILLNHASWKGRPDSLFVYINESDKLTFDKDDINILFVNKKKKNWITRAEVMLSEEEFLALLQYGNYKLDWHTENTHCIAVQPKKIAPLFKEFATVLEYND